MFTKILIANRGENGRNADVSANCLSQTTQWASARSAV